LDTLGKGVEIDVCYSGGGGQLIKINISIKPVYYKMKHVEHLKDTQL
jgi:hypothetical protein